MRPKFGAEFSASCFVRETGRLVLNICGQKGEVLCVELPDG